MIEYNATTGLFDIIEVMSDNRPVPVRKYSDLSQSEKQAVNIIKSIIWDAYLYVCIFGAKIK